MPPKEKKPEVQAMVDSHQAETAADKVTAELRLVALKESLARCVGAHLVHLAVHLAPCLAAALCRSKEEFAGVVSTNQRLKAETATSKADLRDINEYLTNQLKATALTNATLASRCDDLDQRLQEAAAAHAVRAAYLCMPSVSLPGADALLAGRDGPASTGDCS